ncbi:GNAT family N-acetyltransferase [Streptomyces physcomitrii]|uniref:N-acetyltransferase n=1 Tax=Streptomyces physcomitrii TaxID=2724184 RepID=A0ABX1H7M4_9ACTN|nr:GNAT family N-acetyltransferase [Streptomyces physcomitrii]NKI43330.1 N-acetyltransferase [Streptomyces physcomitrii]
MALNPSEVQVRAGVEADLPTLTDIYNHYVRETAVTFDTRVFTPGERRDWLLSHPQDGPHRLLVAQDSGPAPLSGAPIACPEGAPRILGYATSSAYRSRPAYATSVEVSVYLAPGSGGRGIGSRLYEALFAALEGEDVHRAYAAVASASRPAGGEGSNTASLRLHRRFGFRHLGTYHEVGRKFGAWWDVDWYEKELGGA